MLSLYYVYLTYSGTIEANNRNLLVYKGKLLSANFNHS